MPSQNLPKPNLPGQLSTATGDIQPATPSTPPIPPAPGIGVLSRENPAGPPPAMPGLTPQGPLTQPLQLNQDVDTAVTPTLENSAATGDFSVKDEAMSPSPTTPAPVSAADSLTPDEPSNLELKPTQPAQINSANLPPAANEPAITEPIKKKSSPLPKPLLLILGVIALLFIGFMLFKNFLPSNQTKTDPQSDAATNKTTDTAKTSGGVITLTYWGLWEDSEILKSVFDEFEASESIHVDYRKQSHRDYRERLEQAIASGNGPDVFRFHATWTPMLATKLAAMPASVMSASDYQATFYPVAYRQLQSNSQIVGIPLMYDGLALFYNKEMLRTANISVPTTWAELRTAANKLTVPNNPSERNNDNITRGGLAIGNASNVEHFADILALLILQNGGSPAEPGTQYVQDALTFYTNFAKQDKVWSDRLPASTVAFARGEVAMFFAPSWRALEIKALNPELDFALAPVPQLSSDQNITWASYWAEGVNKSSKKQDAAWKLLKYLSSKEVQQKLYASASTVRSFGEPYSRQDLASQLSTDPILAGLIKDAPNAQAFPMASFTHDNGLNDQVIQYYNDAINAVLAGTTPVKALETAAPGIAQVLQKYGAK